MTKDSAALFRLLISLEGTVLSLSSTNAKQLIWDNPKPPLPPERVRGESYLYKVPSCVTNLQQGGKEVINICYQWARHIRIVSHRVQIKLGGLLHSLLIKQPIMRILLLEMNQLINCFSSTWKTSRGNEARHPKFKSHLHMLYIKYLTVLLWFLSGGVFFFFQ